MVKFEDLKRLALEITNRCQASCPMCPRNIHGGIDNPLLKINDWSLDDFKEILNNEILLQINRITFCGNYGDPLLNNDLLEMIRYSVEVAPGIELLIHTNGSIRNKKWWVDLAQSLPANHKVIFGIDGLEDTHSIYRIGTDYNKIIKNATAFINAGGQAEWQFIRFKHNQHQETQAEKIARNLGFYRFSVKDSYRFDKSFPVVNKQGETIYHIDQSDFNTIKFVSKDMVENHKSWKYATEVSCFAQADAEIYIDAHYLAIPCCQMGAYLYMNYDSEVFKQYNLYDDQSVKLVAQKIKEQVWSMLNEIGNVNVLEIGLKNLIASNTWQTFLQYKWQTRGSSVCIITCTPDTPYKNILNQPIRITEFSNV